MSEPEPNGKSEPARFAPVSSSVAADNRLCFHFEDERGRFCLRAERWDGHKRIGGSEAIHIFVSLEMLLRSVAPNDQAQTPPPNDQQP